MTPVLFAPVRPKIYMVIKKLKPFELCVHLQPCPDTFEDGNHHIWTRFCDGIDIVPPGNSIGASAVGWPRVRMTPSVISAKSIIDAIPTRLLCCR